MNPAMQGIFGKRFAHGNHAISSMHEMQLVTLAVLSYHNAHLATNEKVKQTVTH